MTIAQLTKRVADLEAQLKQVRDELLAVKTVGNKSLTPWNEAAGMFKSDPAWDEINRLGRKYRESLRPKKRKPKNGKKTKKMTGTIHRGAA